MNLIKKLKNKKRYKGMTLIEILVSLAIFSVMAGLLVTVCVYINTSVIHTDKINKKMSYQAPIVENRNAGGLVTQSTDTSDYTMRVKINAGAYEEIKIKQHEAAAQSGDEDIAGNFKYFEAVTEATTTT